MKTTRSQHRNPWKWAFITLIAILILAVGFVAVTGTRSANKTLGTTATQKTPASAFDVTLNKQQLNAISAYYLDRYQKNSDQQYAFAVDNDAVLTGQTQLLGITVNYGLSLTPKVLDNGNVALKAKKLAVGSLSMPVSMVLSYVSQHYDLPKWIHLDPSQKTITLDLAHFSTNGISYRATKIDMSGDGQFNFTVRVPKTKS
ncbi:YpmS family protein [Secundilactobacillus kimchicus]|uniref:YpmS family protein n=1 Tax=Secundilactobacillus kimchicus TaxID=528209 RepID=UPI000705004A|nr:YpmS family protein [Secundilactobacillus kimchicus]